MAENRDFELFGMGPAPSEGGEMSDEQFQEEMRQGQAAMAQLRQEESKAKGNDDKLAQIIVQFLSQPGNTDLFLLVSRCVAQNIPSEILITILALVDHAAYMELENIIGESPAFKGLLVPQNSLHPLTEDQKEVINRWLHHISLAALKKPQKTHESFLVKKTAVGARELIQEIYTPLIQLSAFILRNFLIAQQTEVEYETLYEFMESFYLKLITRLENMIQNQKQLS